MKQYYAERNGLIKNSISLSKDELISFFLQTYRYFHKMNIKLAPHRIDYAVSSR